MIENLTYPLSEMYAPEGITVHEASREYPIWGGVIFRIDFTYRGFRSVAEAILEQKTVHGWISADEAVNGAIHAIDRVIQARIAELVAVT